MLIRSHPTLPILDREAGLAGIESSVSKLLSAVCRFGATLVPSLISLETSVRTRVTTPMQHLSAYELTVIFGSLGVLLTAARILGELAQKLHLPDVVGEISAGILLGPTVLGAISPEWHRTLFPDAGPVAIVIDGLATLSIVLFLLVAGMEVDLSTVWRQGPIALRIGCAGTTIPLVVGFAVAWLFPQELGRTPNADKLIFALFFAIAVSISALPVIVKILMDLNLYRTDYGMAVVAACVLNDLVGWMVFATVLSLLGTIPSSGFGIAGTLTATVGFAILMLTIGRWAIHRMLPWLQAYTHLPGGVLSFSLASALFGAALTEWIGVHAVFGSFLVGIAIGDSSHLRERTRATIDQFVSFIFAPLFFASIGLRVNFAAHFDPGLVALVTCTAIVGKIGGCTLGALWGGMPAREATAVGFSMSSVGAMGIIIGVLGLQYELIDVRLFVALVVMALFTSMASGPLTQYALGRRKLRSLAHFLNASNLVPRLSAETRREAIRELSETASAVTGLDAALIEAAVVAREDMLHTGVANGIAIPHARLEGIVDPIVIVGLSESGIDFDAPDGSLARVIFLVLTATHDHGAQTSILALIGQAFRNAESTERAVRARTLTEFLAAIKNDGR